MDISSDGPHSLSRRDLLKTACLVVSFGWGVAREVEGQTAAASSNAAVVESGKPIDPNQVASFLAMKTDGSVTIYTGKVDIGTGFRIAVRQMAAEELGLTVDRVSLVEGDTLLTPDQGSTGGSTGLTRGGVEVRLAAATARETLLRIASQRLQIAAEQLSLSRGKIERSDGRKFEGLSDDAARNLSIEAILEEQRLDLKVDYHAVLKNYSGYEVVGQSLPRPDVPGKCTAKNLYVHDHVVPGMLHGRVIRPASVGAKLLSIDEASLRGIPGVRVVRIESFLGVVAKDEWAAVRAARALKAVWSDASSLPGSRDLANYIRTAEIDRDEDVVTKGDTAKAMPGTVKQYAATYYWPCQSHGSLGPSCAVADVRGDSATIWTSSQGTHALRTKLASIFDLAVEQVRVIYLDGAGSYGGNGSDDAAADAVLLSKTVGQPVRVQWMRHDEHGWDPKGPQQLIDLRAGVDRYGRVQAWEAEMWVPAMIGPAGTVPFLTPADAGLNQPEGQWPGMITQNADPSYISRNVKVVAHRLKTTPLRPSHIRAPGKVANVFAVESFTDELASEAGTDPVRYHEEAISDFRSLDVLRRAASMLGWRPRWSPNPNALQDGLLVGRGIAFARYKQTENYVATAMDVAVDPKTGKIVVRRVTCAHDCGLVVNPDAVQNQIEGSIVQTLSRTLYEEVKFDKSRVTSTDWSSYPIFRFSEVPIITVALINHPEQPIMGAGEASNPTVAAALGNAVFDATGIRFRSAPLTPEKVKAALAKPVSG